jgi:hypothetical protein
LSLGSRFNGGGAFGHASFARGGFDRGFGFNRGFGWRGGGFGCCGFGWGFGSGFGWGFGLGWGLGFGWGGWWNPWWGPSYAWYPPYAYQPYWDWPPYGPVYPSYQAYPPPYDGGYTAPATAPSDNGDSLYGPYSSNSYSNGYSNTAEPGTPLAVDQPDDSPATANVAISAPTALVYMKDGTMLVANDYWVEGGQFHYTVKYGGESQVGVDQVDVQKSIDENAKRGVKFNLKPKPAIASTRGAAKPNAKPATLPPPPALSAPVHGLAAAA